MKYMDHLVALQARAAHEIDDLRRELVQLKARFVFVSVPCNCRLSVNLHACATAPAPEPAPIDGPPP